MLTPITQLNLTVSETIAGSIKGWVAICPESGAFLSQTRGKGKDGLPTFILILPNKTLAERGGLFTDYEWNYPQGRKFIREWSLIEAIETANKKLSKILAKNNYYDKN